jgi:hypothetical protein
LPLFPIFSDINTEVYVGEVEEERKRAEDE